jgi:magnesium transporter
MPADAAADVVLCLPPDRRERVLRALDDQARAAVSALVGTGPDTAGTIMRTDLLVAPADADAGLARALTTDRTRHASPGHAAVYLVDGRRRLAGVAATAAVAAAPADRPLTTLADLDPVAVRAGAGLVDVAELMAGRHLVAVPVVDHGGALLGLVTADDVLGVLTDDLRRRGVRTLLA